MATEKPMTVTHNGRNRASHQYLCLVQNSPGALLLHRPHLSEFINIAKHLLIPPIFSFYDSFSPYSALLPGAVRYTAHIAQRGTRCGYAQR